MAYQGMLPWSGSGRARAAVLLSGAIACATAVGCGDAPGTNDYAWLELGPGGERIARVITAADRCPPLEVDGRTSAMQVRAEPDPPAFPVLTCEGTVPAEATRAAIGAASLPLPPATAERLAVIGDTGCRIEDGHQPQSCNDPQAWPFASLSHAVAEMVAWLTGEPAREDLGDLARSIAALDPDLIVHVGDYLYRESACPDGDPGCAGSPYGYDWETIEADFFAPAEPMFRTAPVVLTRGNHESCSRAGEVWFRFLDPRPYVPDCNDYTEPYAIDAGGLQFLMLDSSAASDTSAMPSQVAIYRQQYATLRDLAGPRAFLVTHRPMWAFGHLGEVGGQETLFRDNPTLQAASATSSARRRGRALGAHPPVRAARLRSAAPAAGRRRQQRHRARPGSDDAARGLEIAGATVAAGRHATRSGSSRSRRKARLGA